MTERDFVYWLQGYFELFGDDETALNERQVKAIKEHIKLVLTKAPMISKEHKDLFTRISEESLLTTAKLC